MGQGWLTLLTLFTAAMTMWLLLYPFDFQSHRTTGWLAERRLSQLHRINFASNLVLFMPLGLLLGWRLLMSGRRSRLGVVMLVTIIAGALSLVGETLQQWLPAETMAYNNVRPGRTSSLLDLLANTVGAGLAAIIATAVSRRFTQYWTLIGAWLARRPRSRKALAVFIIVMLARLAPFDVSPETYYLSTSLRRDWERSGMPLSATRRWMAMNSTTPFGPAYEDAKGAAMAELRGAGICFGLFLVLAITLRRAQRENRWLRGPESPSRSWVVVLISVAAVLGTELMHWPIRSRALDATEPAAGRIAAAIGLVIGSMGLMRRAGDDCS